MTRIRFKRWAIVALAGLACMPAWAEAACELPDGITPGRGVDVQTLDGFYLGGDLCLYDPASVGEEEVPRFKGTRAPPDSPTLYYVNGANGSPVITAINVAALAETSQISVLVIFYAGDGTAPLTHALPAVSSGASVETLKGVIADHLARQEPVHIRGGSAGTVVISEAIHATRNRLAKETRLRGDWAAPLGLLRVETHGSVARDFPNGPRYIHYAAKPDPVPKIGVAGPVAHPGARAVVASFRPGISLGARNETVMSAMQSLQKLNVRPASFEDETALLDVLKAKGLGMDKPFETQDFIAEISRAALVPGAGTTGGVPDVLKDAVAFLSTAFLAVHGAETYDPYRQPFDMLYGADLPVSPRVRQVELETPPPVLEGL